MSAAMPMLARPACVARAAPRTGRTKSLNGKFAPTNPVAPIGSSCPAPATRVQRSQRSRCMAAAVDDDLASTFAEFAEKTGVEMKVALEVEDVVSGNKLVATEDIPAQSLIMRVPRSLCIVVDYVNGMELQDGAWPRTKMGLGMEIALPWDLIQALALVDAMNGDGSPFWMNYSREVLPPPPVLTLPFTLPETLLKELQHNEIIGNAIAQKRRLEALFPVDLHMEMCTPINEGWCTWLQWAYACVRSRAFCIGEEAFAFVPFLDVANHTFGPPPSDFRVAEDGAIELIALRDIKEGEEVTISYTGKEGYTNRRLMAQYGFVPRDGNYADRLDFELSEDMVDMTDEESVKAGGALCLPRMQRLLGDEVFNGMMAGKNHYLFATLRSIPIADAAEGEWPVTHPEVALAEELLAQVKKQQAEMSYTTFEQDSLVMENFDTVLKAYKEDPSLGMKDVDYRHKAVVEYRHERKRLLFTASAVMSRYVDACRDALGEASEAS